MEKPWQTVSHLDTNGFKTNQKFLPNHPHQDVVTPRTRIPKRACKDWAAGFMIMRMKNLKTYSFESFEPIASGSSGNKLRIAGSTKAVFSTLSLDAFPATKSGACTLTFANFDTHTCRTQHFSWKFTTNKKTGGEIPTLLRWARPFYHACNFNIFHVIRRSFGKVQWRILFSHRPVSACAVGTFQSHSNSRDQVCANVAFPDAARAFESYCNVGHGLTWTSRNFHRLDFGF